MPFDPERRYRLDPRVALRHEKFGALAYHYGNRRLTFLRSRALVGLVESLEGYDSARSALDEQIPAPARTRLEGALASLSDSEVISAY